MANDWLPGRRAALREAFRGLVSVMRFFKTRYLNCSKALRAFELGVCATRKLHTVFVALAWQNERGLTGGGARY
jgi:uncharacterized protein